VTRILGVDVGRRRVGLAISDATATLARPLTAIAVSDRTLVGAVAAEIERLALDDDGLAAVVVGLPRRLDGSPSEQTAMVQAFIGELGQRVAVPIVTEDERLTSREAESRLALRERDWRKRKAQLDAAAAAVILQDYLDRMSADRRAQVADVDAFGDEPDSSDGDVRRRD
jgi:putative holliday junction resolvase